MTNVKDTSHLVALMDGLRHEKARLAAATSQREIEWREQIVASREREIAGEMKFLGMSAEPLPAISADDLFAELAG